MRFLLAPMGNSLIPFFVLLALFAIRTPAAAGLPECDSRCGKGNRTQIFLQRSNGTCVRRCIKRNLVPKAYGCGPCPVNDRSRYNTGLALAKVPKPLRSAFTNAAARWERVIVGDLPPTKLKDVRNISICSPYLPLIVDDSFICAAIIPLDGPGGILGIAGPEYSRVELNLPVVSFMQFDSADVDLLVNLSLFDDVIMHEMGRSYGIGSLFWQRNNLLNNQTCQYALNSSATREWQNLTGCTTSIPIDTTAGGGDLCSNWDENCLQGELMTAIPNGGNELSRMTVGTLQDLGYTVNYSAADAFDVTRVNSTCISSCHNSRRRNLSNEYTPKTTPVVLTSKARANAIVYGTNRLDENAANAPPSNTKKEGYTYVADQMVSILYQEKDGSIRSVTVRDKKL